MKRTVLWGLAILVITTLVMVTGCGAGAAKRPFNGVYESVALGEAPAELRATFEQMKAIPGLYVLQAGSETYLLLMAGRTDVAGQRLEVVDIRQRENEVRVTASLLPAGGEEAYLYAVIRLQAAPKQRFTARVVQGEETVELTGLPIPM